MSSILVIKYKNTKYKNDNLQILDFFSRIHNDNGNLNTAQIRALKNKLE